MQHAPDRQTLLWISGATQGIGLGMARNAPYENVRVVNLSRRQHPDYESRFLDLQDQASWAAIGDHFAVELKSFQGERAIFIQNAHLKGSTGFAGETPTEAYERDIIANVAAPLRLGELFIRAALTSGFTGELGLVMMSSSSARSPLEGQSVYCAGKAALEMWVRVARRENRARGRSNFWVTAVRPGFVDTELTRDLSAMSESQYPIAAALRREFHAGERAMDIDTAARKIWAALPTDQSLLLFGEQVSH